MYHITAQILLLNSCTVSNSPVSRWMGPWFPVVSTTAMEAHLQGLYALEYRDLNTCCWEHQRDPYCYWRLWQYSWQFHRQGNFIRPFGQVHLRCIPELCWYQSFLSFDWTCLHGHFAALDQTNLDFDRYSSKRFRYLPRGYQPCLAEWTRIQSLCALWQQYIEQCWHWGTDSVNCFLDRHRAHRPKLEITHSVCSIWQRLVHHPWHSRFIDWLGWYRV